MFWSAPTIIIFTKWAEKYAVPFRLLLDLDDKYLLEFTNEAPQDTNMLHVKFKLNFRRTESSAACMLLEYISGTIGISHACTSSIAMCISIHTKSYLHQLKTPKSIASQLANLWIRHEQAVGTSCLVTSRNECRIGNDQRKMLDNVIHRKWVDRRRLSLSIFQLVASHQVRSETWMSKMHWARHHALFTAA